MMGEMEMKSMMDNHRRLYTRATTVLLAVLLILGPATTLPWVARASVLPQIPEPPPAITDGVWEGVMVSDSTLTGPGASGGGSFYGEMRLTSSGGTLDGSWNLTGTGNVVVEDASGVATYTASGNVGGSSIDPQFAASDVRIDMTITLPDVGPVETSVSMPPGESGIVPMFTYGTCGQIVGTWNVEAEGMVGSGTIVLTRVGDLRPEDAPDYATRVTNLLVDAYAFTESIETAGGTADLAALDDLLSRADSLYNALRRSADCGMEEDADVEGYINLLGDAMEHLLEFALSHPDAFNVSQLRHLATAAVRTGVTIRESWDSIQGRLSADLEGRLETAIDEGDANDVLNIMAIAALIGDWDLIAWAEEASRGME
jgi:hypothetical protein